MIWLAPTIGLLVTSFRPRTDIQATGWWETFTTLRFTTENYEQVLNAQGMGQAFINNMIISIPSTLLPLTLASMAAYAFSWLRFPFRDSLSPATATPPSEPEDSVRQVLDADQR